MRRSMLSLIIGVVCGVIAVALMYNYVATSAPNLVQAAPAIAVGDVVVANKDLPFGATIARENLKTIPWPKGSIPKDAFTKIEEIFSDATKPGDRIALFLIARDEPVTRTKVSGFGAKPTLSRQVENGMRAISVRVDDVVGVAGFVLPGDRVDIFLTRKIGDSLQTQVLLQNIKIVGIDQSADQAAEKPVVARTATIEVTPEQAQKLVLAQQAGSLSLSLRGVESTTEVASKLLTDRDLAGAPRPAPAAPIVRVVAPPPPPPSVPTVRVRYGDGSAVDKVVRP
jgi:pilus assembly protein CpaB